MLFNSLAFAIFFPIAFLLYYAIPQKYRWVFLLIASYYFYMSWKPELIVLLLASTVVDYGCALNMPSSSPQKKKLLMAISLIVNLGLLFSFKYLNFFTGSVGNVLRAISIPFDPPVLNIILPVGISFYTFQTLSYTIDVYRGKTQPERHFGYFALFVSYFPQLVAGPVERAGDLLPELRKDRVFNYDLTTSGARLMALGFFKKLVIADVMAKYVNMVYNNITNYSGFTLIVAAVLFLLQVYADFSGYSDIAVGASRMMGINLTRNFISPFYSPSMKELWQRWNITMSRWFRDYVYFPLGGSRCSKWRAHFNNFLTMVVSGLWHGASWTYVLWGALHGAYLVAESEMQWLLKRIPKPFRILITFTALVAITVFMRANSVGDALYLFGHAFSGVGNPMRYIVSAKAMMGLSGYQIIYLALPIAFIFIFDWFNYERDDVLDRVGALPMIPRWTIYVAFVLFIVMFADKGVPEAFIYFQF